MKIFVENPKYVVRGRTSRARKGKEVKSSIFSDATSPGAFAQLPRQSRGRKSRRIGGEK